MGPADHTEIDGQPGGAADLHVFATGAIPSCGRAMPHIKRVGSFPQAYHSGGCGGYSSAFRYRPTLMR